MPFYVICGKPNCINFVHAAYVAQYLNQRLPNFKYKKIEKTGNEWRGFLIETNKRNKWYHVDSPLIWKEISATGGKPYFIGGLDKFWEHCYIYYGLESIIPRDELKALAADNAKFFYEDAENSSQEKSTFDVVISIIGAASPLTIFLINEILEMPEFLEGRGIFVKLHDENQDDSKKMAALESIVEHFNEFYVYGNRNIVKVAEDLGDIIAECDLLLHIRDYSMLPNQTQLEWLSMCYNEMSNLADVINTRAKRSLRVLFSNDGPVCFLATCLLEFSPILHPTNIVAVTSDQALPFVKTLSDVTGVAISRIAAPPVWGFVGINQFVDIENTVFKADILRPYRRALKNPTNSTLCLGTVMSELRTMSYLVLNNHENIVEFVEKRKRPISRPNRNVLAKVRAVSSLVRLWYSREPEDVIISLGICSDGSFEIPRGIIFSQPAEQDATRKWRPFHNFPLMNDNTKSEINQCLNESKELLSCFEMFDKSEENWSVYSVMDNDSRDVNLNNSFSE